MTKRYFVRKRYDTLHYSTVSERYDTLHVLYCTNPEVHVEVGTTMEKSCRVNRGPLGALDSFEGSMCGITHKMSRSCMTCMTIHDVKNVIIQIQKVMKNE